MEATIKQVWVHLGVVLTMNQHFYTDMELSHIKMFVKQVVIVQN